jgi:hypothetical protein
MIATPTGSKDHSQAAKNPVVEHKGSSDEVVDFVLYLAHVRSLWASDDPDQLSATCPALFAFVDSQAKVFLTCVPEPGGEAMDAAVARARGCHAQLLKSAGQAMVGDSQLAMQDLAIRGEG